MPESFVPLREFFRPAEEAADEDLHSRERPCAAATCATPARSGAAATHGPDAESNHARGVTEGGAFDAFLSEMRCFRAALREMLDAAYERLLRDLACEVLARELRLAPADLQRVAEREIERCEDPRAVRAHPDDAAALTALGIPVRADACLRRGDLVLELRDGELDASLGVRVERVVRALERA